MSKIHQRGWNDDHAHLIGEILDEIQPRPQIRLYIAYTYTYGYELVSDGRSDPFSWMAQLEFQGMKIKHPVAVMHDMFYREGPLSPWVPKNLDGEETAVRRWMDQQYFDGLQDFGHWGRCYSDYYILRMFGYPAYSHYRSRELYGDYSHILNKSIISEKGNAT
jgi:hypothetical protein